MKVVLFSPRIENTLRASYAPLGIMSIATYLNLNGHEAIICDRFFTSKSVEETLDRIKPDIVGVSIIANIFLKDAIAISNAAKGKGYPVVWGGVLPSTLPQKSLESGIVDYISFNEGEYTWLEMADAFDEGKPFDGIKGLGYIRDGKYIRTPNREFVNLETLPTVDWSLVKPENYFQKSYDCENVLMTYLSKGCPNRCTYCYSPGFNHSKRRRRIISQVVDEMRMLSEVYGAGGFDFTDDTMFLTEKDIAEFCNAIIDSRLDICWSGYMSIGTASAPEDYELLYKAGCRSMIFGIESGSERTLRSVNKHMRFDKIKSDIDLCVNAGIIPITMFMLGFPDESEEDLRATVSLAKSLKGAAVSFNYFTSLPGSAIHNELVSSGRAPEFKSIYEYADFKGFETLHKNYTKVKTIDLITIKKYMRIRGIITKTGNSQKDHFAKIIVTTLKPALGLGFLHFIKSMFFAAFSLIRTFTIFFHPKIRKRYGLYFTK